MKDIGKKEKKGGVNGLFEQLLTYFTTTYR